MVLSFAAMQVKLLSEGSETSRFEMNGTPVPTAVWRDQPQDALEQTMHL